MADLPRIFARPELPEVGLPRTHPDAYGAQLFHTLAEVGAAMREKQKPIDAAKHASEYDVAMDDLKNEIQADPDPNNWREIFTTKEATIREKMLEGISDPATKEAFTFHVQRSLGRHIIDVSDRGIKASHAKQLGDMEIVGATLARQAAETQDEGLRSSYINTFNAMINAAATPSAIGGRAVPSTLTPKAAEAAKQKFERDVLENRASLSLEADPSSFLRSVKSDEWKMLDPDKRRALVRSANEAISASITLYNREQKIKEEQADREIQGLFDSGAGVDVIQTRLQQLSAAGIIDRASRAFWDNKFIKEEKGDTAPQIANAERLTANFLEAGYPTMGNIRKTRDEARGMRNSGAIGDKGSSKIQNMLIIAEQRLRSEGRAEAAAGRAAAGAGGGGKMSNAAAMQLIARNFPGANPNRPIMPSHKEDTKEFTNRAVLAGEDAGTVAKDIYQRREKAIQAEKQKRQERETAAKTDPKTAAILDRLKGLKK